MKVAKTLAGLKGRYRFSEAIITDNGMHAYMALGELFNMTLIGSGKLMGNGFVESFNGQFRDERLKTQWFVSMKDAQEKIEV